MRETWKIVATTMVPFVGGFVVLRLLEGSSSSSAPPFVPAAPGGAGEPTQITQSPIQMQTGRTYFAVLEANGTVSAAANAERVKAEAEKQGFRDVAVFTTRPESFPGRATSDYYVRATYQGAPRSLPRKTSVFLGSVVVVDAWIAT